MNENRVGEGSKSILDQIKESGEDAFAEISNHLLDNPLFLNAMQKSLDAKRTVDDTINRTLDFMSLPSKNDAERILNEIGRIHQKIVKQSKIINKLQQDITSLHDMLTPGAKK